MAYEITKNNIELFNKTYGVDISLSKIKSEAKRLNSYNDALRAVFLEAYKKAVMKDLIKNEDDYLFSKNMFVDFNRSITNNLIDETPRSRRIGLSKNMGIKNSLEAYNMLEAVLKDIPKNNIDLVAENYKNGNIRIRDMVRFSILTKYDSRSNMIIASYAEALKKVNASRSFLWRVFHPFRNHAEKRDAKLIEESAKKFITDSLYNKAFNKAQSQLVNEERIEKETKDQILYGENVIEKDIDIDIDNMEIDIEAIERNNDIKLNEEERAKLIQKIKIERLREIEIEKAHIKSQEFAKWLKETNEIAERENEAIQNAQKSDNEANNNDDSQINADNNKEEKKNISVDNLKEDVYEKNEPNNKIEESKIDAPSIVKNK